MLIVKVGKEKGDIEKALKKMKNKVRSTKLILELRKRKAFIKPSEIRREEKKKAIYIQEKFREKDD